MGDLEFYSGKLVYKEMEFNFVFDKCELRLIPLKAIAAVVYEEKENWQYIEAPYLVGSCNETETKIIFFCEQQGIGSYNNILRIFVDAYILYRFDCNEIDKISFSSPEIDGIFPVGQAISEQKWLEEGIVTVQTKKFSATTSEKQYFIVEGKDVTVHFGIARTTNRKIGEPPIVLQSSMFFEFEPTSDYQFIFRLWRIAKTFIQYLCYRKNCYLPIVDVYGFDREKMHLKIATLNVTDEWGKEEKRAIETKRYIQQKYISGFEGKILEDIGDNMLYTRHIPDTYLSGQTIDEARFVMITAAFEWEFRRNYPEGIKKAESTIEIEQKITAEIDKLIDEAPSRKLKKKYKFLRKLVGANSLQAEIMQIGEDYSDLMDSFGKPLYLLNNVELKYPEMGERLANQRNDFAHGNLDKDFNGTALLDLLYLSYLIYAMQLRAYGISDENIKNAISGLFHYRVYE